MPDIQLASIGDPVAVVRLAEQLASHVPGLTLSALSIGEEGTLASEGVAYHWVDSGQGQIHVPAGHRTQEGDGEPLPPPYRAVPPTAEQADAVAEAARRLQPGTEPAKQIAALLRRSADQAPGEIGSDLTRIREAAADLPGWPGPALDAFRRLLALADEVGLSERTVSGWERIEPGDLLVTSPDRPMRLRGPVRLWRIEDRLRTTFPPHTALRRLRHLRDTAGGCAPGEGGFRRLALPWRLPADAGLGDGENRVNSHAVNIVERLSRTHVHPDPPVTGHAPQWELYLVMEAGARGLPGAGRRPRLHTFPDLSDLATWVETPLAPGDLVVIPPNTGHRGIDVLANVVTTPGFKPLNEIYLDGLIASATGAAAPHNPLFAAASQPAGPAEAVPA